MIRCLFIILGICLASAALADTRVVDIADGDFASLQNALCDAALGNFSKTVIRLAERGYYTPARSVPSRASRWRACWYGGRAGNIPLSPGAGTILSNVVIEGNNATLDFEGGTGLSVAEGAQLLLEAVELRNTQWALAVDGRAELRRVSVIFSRPEYPDQRAPIHNRGELVMRSTVVAGNRLSQVPAELLVATAALDECSDTASSGILNEGTLIANNITLADNQWELVDLPEPPSGDCVSRDLVNLPGAEAWFSNSILTSGLFANCVGTVTSRGYNSVSEGAVCGFVGPEDTVMFEAGVYPFVPHEEGRQMNRYLLFPDPERLQPGSPEAVGDSPSACEALDVRGHVRGVLSENCYRGALDLAAAPALDSGLDGLWFDPENDGQYLQISHYAIDRILLTWLSFDSIGEQLWVYASGVFAGGNSVRLEAYKNSGVRIVDGRLEGQLEAIPWGELSVEALACDRLLFRPEPFNPDSTRADPHLLVRLTNNAVADCSN